MKYRYGTQKYWKTASEYQFKTLNPITGGSSKLSVYAHSPRAAKLKAHNWEKWLIREKRGKDRVYINTIQKI